MDKPFDAMKTIDYMFYWGLSPLDEENRHDVILGLLQPKRKLLYDREDGAGVSEMENFPASLIQIQGKYNIARWFGWRNSQVSTGQNGLPDRRLAASQDTVDIVLGNAGEIDVSVLYYSLADYKQPKTLSASAGIGASA